MDKKEYLIELDDLPDDCIAEILKKVKTRLHRSDARLVCRFWHHLIDSDSSSESYLVDKRTTRHVDDDKLTKPKFSEFIPQFLTFNRKKISFRFEQVNLRSTEHFWTEKGVHINSLKFEVECEEIPLELIFSKCIRLREMCIDYSIDEIIDALESLATKESYNYSLNFLTITNFYGVITGKDAIRLVELISKVFPRMRKVTLYKFLDKHRSYEELSKEFIQLKCELELNSYGYRIVFDSSSKTPISVRKVYTQYRTMSPPEYYKDLEEITYLNHYHKFHLSQLENVFSEYPMLESLGIDGGIFMCDLRKPIRNQLKGLNLLHANHEGEFTVSTEFLDTFRFLKIFHLQNVPPAIFMDILLNMEHLEDLSIMNSIEMADLCETNKEREIIVHNNLKKLTIPLFLSSQSHVIYRFDNLMEITIRRNGFETSAKPEMQNVDNDKFLQPFQCSNLKHIWFLVKMSTSKSIDLLWLKNWMSMFPKLEQFSFYLRGSDDLITEDQQLGLRQICPKLYISDRYISEGIIERHLALTKMFQYNYLPSTWFQHISAYNKYLTSI